MKSFAFVVLFCVPVFMNAQSDRLKYVSDVIFEYYIVATEGIEKERAYGDTCKIVLSSTYNYTQKELNRHSRYLVTRGSTVKTITKSPVYLKLRTEDIFIRASLVNGYIVISLYEQ